MKNILHLLTAILRTDGYKPSQWLQYPPNTTHISSYIESRGGEQKSTFLGLQPWLMDYMTTPLTMADVNFAELVFRVYGAPFNREGWERIVNEFGGYLPLEIMAVPEGTVMETHNIQVQVQNSISGFGWLTSYIEMAMLRGVWYPSTVATKSRKFKKIIAKALIKTSDIPVDVLMNVVIKFALHDFGGRGVSSTESAVLGGMAHLVNFWGSDTVEGILGAYAYYNADITSVDAPPVARTIPASEHSTVTSWGRFNEVEAYRNMVKQFSFAGSIYACVSDSYNIYEAVRELWGNQLKDLVIDSGGTLVVRPDSGDPMTVPIEIMDILAECFGYTVNSKGYKVLAKRPDGSPIVKVIQGDGLNEHTLQVLVDNIIAAGYSLENIAFGMGGGLLQAWNRDTLKYAMKASAIRIADGEWVGFSKDPVGDHGKKSKEGRLALVHQCGLGSCGYRTLPEEIVKPEDNLLKLVYLNGELFNHSIFEEVRQRSELKPNEYEDVIVERY